jgi:mono/diheme cytochrome c family protein
MHKIIAGLILTALVLGLLPFALIARSRASQRDALPPHLVLDMDKQPKFKAQRATPMFADHRAMRPEVQGTFAREDFWIKSELLNDPATPGLIPLAGGKDAYQLDTPTAFAAVTLGRIRPENMTDEQFAALVPPTANDKVINDDNAFYVRRIPTPIAVTAQLLHRGQERFNIYCAPCHGEDGSGDGPIHERASNLMSLGADGTTWVQPQNLTEPKIMARPDGHIFNTITNGIRNMPAYDKQISIPDRWAIIAYVRALELSQNAPTPTP